MKNKVTVICALILVLLAIFSVSTGNETNSLQADETFPQGEIEAITTVPETTVPETTTVNKFTSLGEFTITAYCSCERCCGKYAKSRPKDEYGNEVVITASGRVAESGKTIAVDPDVIPYGTVVVIDEQEYIATDTMAQSIINRYGGKVIDVYFDNHDDAVRYGKQKHEVFIKEVAS